MGDRAADCTSKGESGVESNTTQGLLARVRDLLNDRIDLGGTGSRRHDVNGTERDGEKEKIT
jgi:hypothetical protein